MKALNNNIPNVVLVYAFRYGLPRETNAVVDAIECIKQNINNFANWELVSIMEEIRYHNEMNVLAKRKLSNQRDVDNFTFWLKEIIGMRQEMIKGGIK